ncbi:IS982 family transposase [Spirosoma luteum]|uniref:IS982 family transposase n=2 Tax=Spirosoma luteum TaxID=431553 RepID=UPI000377D310|nr:IS982 family transposase [Spirosoma luteum]
MQSQISEEKLIELFIAVDDFVNLFDQWLASRALAPTRQPTRQPELSNSEIITILVYYHHSGYKNFQYYYQRLVQTQMPTYFPRLVTYQRFIDLLPRQVATIHVLTKYLCLLSKRTGCYFADSKKLPVCDNRRIHFHRVFKDIASRGKSSTGWFYGLKLHLVINQLGQVMNFLLTPASVSDNNETVLGRLLGSLTGKCYADKGYISKLFEQFYQQGLHIITKIRKNMKNSVMDLDDKLRLKKRALIESVNDILMSVMDVDHSRHRSPLNAIVHTMAGLVAYHFYDTKPSVFVKPVHA